LFFQILDDKKECTTIYCQGELKKNTDFLNLTHTWFPTSLFGDTKECAHIWCGGKSLNEACPENLREEWCALNDRAKAYFNSFAHARINLSDICFYDLVPSSFLLRFYEMKNKISQSVFDESPKPLNYEFLHDLIIFLKKIERQHLNLKIESLNLYDEKIRNSIGKVKNYPPNITYDPWGTATGRLTTKKNSFPILTLNKELRSVLHPTNDLFIELDYNAAELRVLFGLLGQTQPAEDIHSWISKNIFGDKYDRNQTKKKVFSWLYNPKAKNKKLNEYLNRDMVYEKYYKNGCILTPYGRKLTTAPEKAVNFLVQSTTSDLFLTSAMKIDRILDTKKSFIAFCIHDSLIIDVAKEDKEILHFLTEQFSDTKFGKFKANVSAGKNFGSMRKIL